MGFCCSSFSTISMNIRMECRPPVHVPNSIRAEFTKLFDLIRFSRNRKFTECEWYLIRMKALWRDVDKLKVNRISIQIR